jgi:glutathione S-transferase
VVITESAAICTYIGEKFPQSDLVPTDLKERAYYFKWSFFIMTELEAPLWAKAKHTRFLPEERRVPEVAGTCDWEFHRALALVAQQVRDQEFLVGGRFTAADIMLSGILNWARKAGTNLESPTLEAYAERMSSRPALARALDAEQKAIVARAQAQI